MNSLKIIIADDHTIFREGLKQVVARSDNMKVVDEAGSGAELLAKLTEGEFDLVILDISLPGRSGLEILTDIRRSKPRLPVLILSMHPEEQYALRALKLGAAGYLTKGSSSQELVEALQKVALGKKYVSPAMAELLACRLGAEPVGPLHERLSDRELQVMHLIAAGATPKKIAEELLVGIRTVNTYRVRILQKMNMKSNADITRYALEHQLI